MGGSLAHSAVVLSGMALDGAGEIRQALGMIRFVQIALLIAFFAGNAAAQSAAEIGSQIRERWISCVRSTHSAALTVGHSSAEDAFRACDTEEQLYLAAVAASFSEPGSINRIRFNHFSERAKLKTELNNAIFKEMTRRMNKP